MSDTSQGPGWWLASDGRWYPPELAPAAPPAAGRGGELGPTDGRVVTPAWNPWQAPAPSVSPGLARALRVVFYVVAALAALGVVLSLWTLLTWKAFEGDPTRSNYDTWRLPDAIRGGVGLLYGVGTLALLVVFIIWSWQAHRAATGLGATLSWKIGWTIGAWFIPCASIVLPKLVMNTIERAAMSKRRDGRPRARWDTNSTSFIGWVWWIAFIASNVRFSFTVSSTGDAVLDATTQGSSYSTAYVVGIIAGLLTIVSALAGAVYTRRISDRLTPEGLAAYRND